MQVKSTVIKTFSPGHEPVWFQQNNHTPHSPYQKPPGMHALLAKNPGNFKGQTSNIQNPPRQKPGKILHQGLTKQEKYLILIMYE
jgi:hypothetical protein